MLSDSNPESEPVEVDFVSLFGSLSDVLEPAFDETEPSCLTGALFTSTIPESGCMGAAATRVAEAEEAAVRRTMAVKEKRIMDVMERFEELR